MLMHADFGNERRLGRYFSPGVNQSTEKLVLSKSICNEGKDDN
jgi:hypothetical protein